LARRTVVHGVIAAVRREDRIDAAASHRGRPSPHARPRWLPERGPCLRSPARWWLDTQSRCIDGAPVREADAG